MLQTDNQDVILIQTDKSSPQLSDITACIVVGNETFFMYLMLSKLFESNVIVVNGYYKYFDL